MIQTKINGEIKEGVDCKVKVDGKIKQGLEMLVKVNGKWKQIWQNVITILEIDGVEQTIEVKGAKSGNVLKLYGVKLTGELYGSHYEEVAEPFEIGRPSLNGLNGRTIRQVDIRYGSTIVAIVTFSVHGDGNLGIDFTDSNGNNIILTIEKIEIIN